MVKAVPQSEISGSLAQEEEGSAVLGNVSDTPTRVDFPLAEGAKFSLDDHRNIMIKIYQLNNQKINNLPLLSPFLLLLPSNATHFLDFLSASFLLIIIINHES